MPFLLKAPNAELSNNLPTVSHNNHPTPGVPFPVAGLEEKNVPRPPPCQAPNFQLDKAAWRFSCFHTSYLYSHHHYFFSSISFLLNILIFTYLHIFNTFYLYFCLLEFSFFHFSSLLGFYIWIFSTEKHLPCLCFDLSAYSDWSCTCIVLPKANLYQTMPKDFSSGI